MKRLLSEKAFEIADGSWSARRFAAATIFMDLVICRVLSMLFILLRIARMFATCPTSFLSVAAAGALPALTADVFQAPRSF